MAADLTPPEAGAGPYARHLYSSDRGFHNPHIRRDRRGLAQLLKWARESKRLPWPKHIKDPHYQRPRAPAQGEISASFIGHSSFLLTLPGLTLITDPIFSDYCSPVPGIGPRRVRKPGIALDDLPKIDVILLSHNHYDHADLPSLKALAKAHKPIAVTPAGNGKLLRRAGIETVHELHWFESVELGSTRITVTPAQHFSRRAVRDFNKSLWGGLMVDNPHGKIFFAGDSGHGPHWAEIATRLGSPDLALLPIGAYAPSWLMAPVHINPEEALAAHQDLGARQSLGMHFGTFRLTEEPIDEPEARLRAACSAAGVDNFTTLGFGEGRIFTGRV